MREPAGMAEGEVNGSHRATSPAPTLGQQREGKGRGKQRGRTGKGAIPVGVPVEPEPW